MQRLILVDPNGAMVNAWREAFDGLDGINVVHGGFEDLPEFDCMVSAANSFGIMDGGVDAAITRFFGPQLQGEVQRRILADHLGEQLVGTSIIVPTNHPGHPFLAHTPTMRVPLEIAGTENVYCAMWAMLLAVRRHNAEDDRPIRIVACPGLGTGVGKMPFGEAARQMALAYRRFLNPPATITWHGAAIRQVELQYGGEKPLRGL